MKQYLRTWFDKFAKAMQKLGYAQAHMDQTLFIGIKMKEKLFLLSVDEIILIGEDYDVIGHITEKIVVDFK